MLVIFVINIILLMIMRFYLDRKNKKRDSEQRRVIDPDDQT